MSQLLDDNQKNEILTALNLATDSDVWQKSNFLRVMGRQLQEVRDAFKNMMASNQTSISPIEPDNTRVNAKDTQVYISMYSAKGADLKTWEHMLTNLPKQMVARPIYTKEENVIALIRSKPNPANEAYVCVTIPTDCIVDLPVEKVPLDKLNQPLTTTKGRPLPPLYEGIFVHSSGKYRFSKGRLVKIL